MVCIGAITIMGTPLCSLILYSTDKWVSTNHNYNHRCTIEKGIKGYSLILYSTDKMALVGLQLTCESVFPVDMAIPSRNTTSLPWLEVEVLSLYNDQ